LICDTVEVSLIGCRFLQGPEIPERQLYKEPPEAFLEADNMDEVRDEGVATQAIFLPEDGIQVPITNFTQINPITYNCEAILT
jgi:hypothetical protein